MKLIIGASMPTTWKAGAELIKLYEGVPYSHVYLRVYTTWTNRWLVYQASHGDVNCITFANFQNRNEVFAEWEVDLSDDKHKDVVGYCQDELQKPYGFFGLLKIALKKKFKMSGDGDNTFHCSELITRAFPDIVNFIDEKNPDFITPKHLVEALGKCPDAKRLI
jgi:uncharacterized protein YycO